jgi:CBS domain-containing protein
VRLAPGREIDLLQGLTVAEVMASPPPLIRGDATLLELRDALRQHGRHALCVIDQAGLLMGMVTLSDLRRAYETESGRASQVADICARNVATIGPEAKLWTAIRLMGQRDVGRLPVVKRGSRALVGLVGRQDLMRAYHEAITRRIEGQQAAEHIRLDALTEGHAMEFHVAGGSKAAGRRVRDVAWPAESVVAAIRRDGRLLIPHGDTRLEPGDGLTIVAAPEVEGALRRLLE